MAGAAGGELLALYAVPFDQRSPQQAARLQQLDQVYKQRAKEEEEEEKEDTSSRSSSRFCWVWLVTSSPSISRRSSRVLDVVDCQFRRRTPLAAAPVGRTLAVVSACLRQRQPQPRALRAQFPVEGARSGVPRHVLRGDGFWGWLMLLSEFLRHCGADRWFFPFPLTALVEVDSGTSGAHS